MKKRLLFLVALGLLVSSVACQQVTNIPVTRVTISPSDMILVIGESSTLTITVEPSDATNNTVTWTSSDDRVVIVEDGKVTGISEGSATISAIAGAKKATCSVSVITPSVAIPEAIDLGLNVKWASFNVGANAPEAYGHYYAWGETKTKELYTWETYRWADNGELTKYITLEESRLYSSDDAARVVLGGEWRMPNKKECDALIEWCVWEKTKMGGVDGWLITSMIEGYTDKSIFLPAAGIIDGGEVSLSSTLALYWTSEGNPIISPESALILHAEDGFPPAYVDTHENYRCWGLPVRPVLYNEEQGYVPVMNIGIDYKEVELFIGESISLKTQVRPEWASNSNVSWSSSNSQIASVDNGYVTAIAEGTAIVRAKADGKEAICQVVVKRRSDEMDETKVVDLGLSVKWASCNLGANAPEEIGDYYAWGETETKTVFDYATYKWYEEGGITKYCDLQGNSYWVGMGSPDMKGLLDKEDDAAYAILGEGWRVPTHAEIIELKDNCSFTRVTQNDVQGVKLTSKINGNSIFFPYSGCIDGNTLTQSKDAICWASLRSPNNYYASVLHLGSLSSPSVTGKDRFKGLVIRPVYGDLVHVSAVSMDKADAIIPSKGSSLLLTATLSPSNPSEPCLYWKSDNRDIADIDDTNHEDGLGVVRAWRAGTATITAYTADGNYSASCTITVKEDIPVPEAVDLGLSVKWASCNLGAECPEDFGGHWAWGELEQKRSYGYDNYSGELFYDAAQDQLGSNWRIPTLHEIVELESNCDQEWLCLNGINGYRFTSKKNGNSIFLPAAGFWGWYNSVFHDLNYVGQKGLYWSLSPSDDGKASYLDFDSQEIHCFVSNSRFENYYGLSIRPVYGDAVVSSIRLNKDDFHLTIGHESTLYVLSDPYNAVITSAEKLSCWSDNATVAGVVVNNDGSLTVWANRVGDTTLHVQWGDFHTSCKVWVIENPQERFGP